MRSLLAVAAVVLLWVVPGPASAQTCDKGKPCGNSCINVNETCHVGSGTASTRERSGSASADSGDACTALGCGAFAVAGVALLALATAGIGSVASWGSGCG